MSEEPKDIKEILAEKLETFGKIMDKHAVEIESHAQNIESIKNQINMMPAEILNAINNNFPTMLQNALVQMQNNQAVQGQQGQQGQLGMKDLLMNQNTVQMAVEKILTKIVGSDAPPTNFLGLDESYIQEKIRNSVMGNFELGESLIDAVKAGFKRKTVGKTVQNVLEHGIE